MYGLIVEYSVFTVLRIYFRKRFSSNKKSIEYHEGRTGIEILNVLIIFEVISFAAYIIFTEIMPGSVPFSIFFPVAVRAAGLISGAGALILFINVHMALGRNFSMRIQIRQEQKLVKTGPYRRVRHPMYTAFMLLHIGVFLASANGFIGILWIAGLSIVIAFRLPIEEKQLLMKFGDEYAEYISETGRFLPRLNAFKEVEE